MINARFLKDEMLVCPKCGEPHLHQMEVEVFTRRKEDDPSLAVLVDRTGAPKLGTPGNNPSDRRDGLIIYFLCEFCHTSDHFAKFERPIAFRLAIYQHKGITYVRWLDG